MARIEISKMMTGSNMTETTSVGRHGAEGGASRNKHAFEAVRDW
jgi:hypothetical protein